MWNDKHAVSERMVPNNLEIKGFMIKRVILGYDYCSVCIMAGPTMYISLYFIRETLILGWLCIYFWIHMFRKCMVGWMIGSCCEDFASCVYRTARPIDESHASLNVTSYFSFNQFH